jgi:polar amino acid transport system substrate-binding protein
MFKFVRPGLLGAVVVVLAACSGSASNGPGGASGLLPAQSYTPTPTVRLPYGSPTPGGLLDKVLKAGKLIVATDPNKPPMSEQNPDGSYQGFDVEVATEIARRLGVRVAFVAPKLGVITAGGWKSQWDVAVGSVTITGDRQKVVDFSPPYYFTPVQLAASKTSGITSIGGLAGKAICAAKSSTYLEWLSGKQLDLAPLSAPVAPPAGVKPVAKEADMDCPRALAAGDQAFQGWLSASTTVERAISRKLPVVKVGDRVYVEALGVAVDRGGPDDTDFVARLTDIVNDMHSDGTLTTLSMKWFKADLTVQPGS